MTRRLFGYSILILCAISMLAPFFYMLYISLCPESAVFSGRFEGLGLQSCKSVFASIPISKYFLNSIFVASIVTFFLVLTSAMAGFAFARLKFPARDAIFFVFLITMMVPPQVNIIPLFFLLRELSMINTYSALILPAIFGGFGVFLMRQWFLSFPDELEQSAKIDGCSTFKFFFKIALPLALPAIATLAIFTFITIYNSFLWPLIATTSESMRTLPVGIAIFKGSFRETTLWSELMASSVISTIPVIGVFLLGKKYFINDILAGGIKE